MTKQKSYDERKYLFFSRLILAGFLLVVTGLICLIVGVVHYEKNWFWIVVCCGGVILAAGIALMAIFAPHSEKYRKLITTARGFALSEDSYYIFYEGIYITFLREGIQLRSGDGTEQYTLSYSEITVFRKTYECFKKRTGMRQFVTVKISPNEDIDRSENFCEIISRGEETQPFYIIDIEETERFEKMRQKLGISVTEIVIRNQPKPVKRAVFSGHGKKIVIDGRGIRCHDMDINESKKLYWDEIFSITRKKAIVKKKERTYLVIDSGDDVTETIDCGAYEYLKEQFPEKCRD